MKIKLNFVELSGTIMFLSLGSCRATGDRSFLHRPARAFLPSAGAILALLGAKLSPEQKVIAKILGLVSYPLSFAAA